MSSGGGPLVGAQVRYLIGNGEDWLAGLAFSASAWQVAARDRWIGWGSEARRSNLQYVVCNSRFLIAPWVRVDNLASKVLALCAARLGQDWEELYGYRPLLLETYVDPQHHSGACCRAANWVCVGHSSGRGRQDRQRRGGLSRKDIYVRPLERGWQERLRAVRGRRPRVAARLAGAPKDWAEQEFGGAQLGDRRLSQRLIEMGRSFYARPQANIPLACGRAGAKGAYRLLSHGKVRMEEILAPHYESSVRRIAEHPVVLAVQDTTSFNYSTHPALEGQGLIGTHAEGPTGIWMHDTMAFTPEGLPLGLVDVQLWVRAAQELSKRARRKELPIEAPPEVEPLEWMLLTTLEVASTEHAPEKLRWYARRWGIEVFHKALKSGCRIEERQLATVPRIENCRAIDLVVAWRVMRLTMLGRATPDVPCPIYFEEHEWKALYAFVGKGLHAIPDHTPCLRDARRMLAQLGGFLGRKGDGAPGIKSMWIGLQRLDDISGAWLQFGPGSPLQPNQPLAAAHPVSRNPRYG